MKKLLFRLDRVPEEEAEEIRTLLRHHQIDFHETPGGRWGVSVAAIWVADKTTFLAARPLIDRYSEQRAAAAQEAYARAKAEGRAETLLDRALRRPITFILYSLLAGAILYFSIVPFFHLGQ